MSAMISKHVLEAIGVVAGYRPELPIIHDVNMYVNAGEIVTIIGPNGAGKSTFIRAIAGLLTVTSGKVMLDGNDITGVPAHLMAESGIGFVPQTDNVFTTLSIHENLVLGGITLPRVQADIRIAEIYERYSILKDRSREKAGILSGGQRQVLAVARALLNQPRLILLDEPTAGLSPMASHELFTVVRDLAKDGAAVLMVEQNAKAALRISDRGYVLAEGKNRISGPAKELLEDSEIGKIFLGVQREKTNGRQKMGES